jgi:acid stress chaperone HdeB
MKHPTPSDFIVDVQESHVSVIFKPSDSHYWVFTSFHGLWGAVEVNVLSSIVFAPASAQAQVVVDVSKITCDQYVHAKITTPNLIAAWLSGYYNAKRNNRIVDLETLEDNVSKVKNYCYDEKNFKVPIMKAVEVI